MMYPIFGIDKIVGSLYLLQSQIFEWSLPRLTPRDATMRRFVFSTVKVPGSFLVDHN